MSRYFNIWLRQLKNGLSIRMIHPINFFVMCIGVFLEMSITFIFLQVIFKFVNNFSGWSHSEAMIVVASYMIIEGLMWTTVSMLGGLSRNVRTGFLDVLLVKPINTQFIVSVWSSDPEDSVRLITAISILFFNVPNLGLSNFQLVINGLLYVVLMVDAYFIVYSIFLMVKSINFWTVQGWSIHMIGEKIVQSSMYPVDIFFHKIVRVVFSTIIPLAFIATIPAKILIHGPRLDLAIYSILIALIFFYVSHKFFLFGLKRYESASS